MGIYFGISLYLILVANVTVTIAQFPKIGNAGIRTQGLLHAMQALYH